MGPFDDLIPGSPAAKAPAPRTPQIVFTTPKGPTADTDVALKDVSLSNARKEGTLKDLQINKARDEIAANSVTQVSSDTHGDAYLKSVPPQIAGVVKKIASGEMAPPSGAALKTPYWQQVFQHVINYDPEFAGQDYGTRAKTRADYATGKMGVNITALNTALGHAGEVLGGIEGLDNYTGIVGRSIVNPLTNLYRDSSGDPRIPEFENSVRAFSSELAKVFVPSGGTEGERQEWNTSIPLNGSPEQQRGVLKQDARLLKSRLEALNEQYKRGMGRSADIIDLLNPHAKEVYLKLLADDGKGGPPGAGGTPPATDPAHTPGGGQVVFNDEMPDKASGSYRLTPTQEAGLVTLAKSGATAEQLQAKYAEFGHPNANIDNLRQVQQFYADPKNRSVDIGFDYSKVDAIKPVDAGDGATGAAVRGAADTGSLGLLPRATAVSEALRNDTRYSDELDKQRGMRAFDASQHPIAQLGGSLVGGVAVPIGLEARTPGEIARAGATIGTIYGYNSSYGSVPEKLASAAKGGVAGLATGYGIAKGTPALAQAYQRIANRPSAVAARTATGATRQEGADIAAAGQAENVPVNRAMVNPALQNRVTAAEATFGGGPIVRRSMADVARGIEGRVNDLGAGGSALEPVVGGNKVQGAAERYIKQSGAVARRQYDHAEKLAGDIKVPPQEMGTAVGAIITRLSETPSINAPEIAFMKSIENDLGKNLSVGALRRFRTQLRGKISKGELTFGESEADVLGVMDAASRDIENGLRAAGKGKAADAFHSADAAYRQRMDFIGGTVQKLIGKRNANVSPEATLARFKAMASPKGDVEGLGKMLAVMEPGEASDVAATFAAELGRNNKGEFSTAHLLSQAEKLSPAARKTIFGDAGAESLANLQILAKAHNRVYSQLNHSKSGVANVARDYRSWIAGAVGLGAGSGTNLITGAASALGTAGAVAAKDILSARALMSPKVAKWLASAPSSASAIPAHIARLGPIAAREPAIANEVVALQQRLTDSFVGPYKAAAGGNDRNDRRPPPGSKQRAQQPTFHMP